MYNQYLHHGDGTLGKSDTRISCEAPWEPLESTHSQLKEIEIASCVGNWYETEFAIFMLLKVHGLAQIVSTPPEGTMLEEGNGRKVGVS